MMRMSEYPHVNSVAMRLHAMLLVEISHAPGLPRILFGRLAMAGAAVNISSVVVAISKGTFILFSVLGIRD